MLVGAIAFVVFMLVAIYWAVTFSPIKRITGTRRSGPNVDKYHTLPDLKKSMAMAGVEDVNLIVAIDLTKSNIENGAESFGGRSLHHIGLDPTDRNPYQRVIESCITSLLDVLDEDRVIPTLVFGDLESKERGGCRYIDPEAYGFIGVLNAYNREIPQATMSGPTTFGPILKEAMRIVRGKGMTYHILLIICDGQITDWATTNAELANACEYPLSIVIVGVGDGPWDEMQFLDDDADNLWDNVQFVLYDAAFSNEVFAVHALQEIPDQFIEIRARGLIGNNM